MKQKNILIITFVLVIMTLVAFPSNAKGMYGKKAGPKHYLPIDGKMYTTQNVRRGNSPNYYTSEESYQFFYEGYVQFRPSYYTQPGDGYKLSPYQYVKQAFIDYERNGKSVSKSGANYTNEAYSIHDDAIYRTSIKARDSFIPGDENITYFVIRWFYFIYGNYN